MQMQVKFARPWRAYRVGDVTALEPCVAEMLLHRGVCDVPDPPQAKPKRKRQPRADNTVGDKHDDCTV